MMLQGKKSNVMDFMEAEQSVGKLTCISIKEIFTGIGGLYWVELGGI